MHAYLELVAKTEHYKTLKILGEGETEFLQLIGPESGLVDRFLYRSGIIFMEHVSQPVLFDDQEIGSLKGERYIRYVYPLFYIFLGLSFAALTLTFIISLIFNRRFLEKQVQERTKKYQDLVNLLPEMVIETDGDGWITFANEKATECFGIDNPSKSQLNCRDCIFHQ